MSTVTETPTIRMTRESIEFGALASKVYDFIQEIKDSDDISFIQSCYCSTREDINEFELGILKDINPKRAINYATLTDFLRGELNTVYENAMGARRR